MLLGTFWVSVVVPLCSVPTLLFSVGTVGFCECSLPSAGVCGCSSFPSVGFSGVSFPSSPSAGFSVSANSKKLEKYPKTLVPKPSNIGSASKPSITSFLTVLYLTPNSPNSLKAVLISILS